MNAVVALLFFHCRIAFSSGLSLGQSIQGVSSIKQGIQVADEFWLPSDKELPTHCSQPVHHESRQRWASQLLEKIFQISANDSLDDLDFRSAQWNRLVNAAAIPHLQFSDRPKKEGIWVCTSLRSIYGLVSRKQGLIQNVNIPSLQLQTQTLAAIRQLIERAYLLAGQFSLDQVCQLHWSVEGLYARVPELDRLPEREKLVERLSKLPFEIIPRGLDWTEAWDGICIEWDDQVCEVLIESIPFSKDTIVTRRGVSVQERRGTAWLAKPGIGSLAYSGKLMSAQPIHDRILKVMGLVEDRLDLVEEGGFFDCVLCNHYADSTAACKYHTDPEHGSFWHRTTVVVAAGTDRKFSFKPIETSWSDWDPLEVDNGEQSMAASINLFSGDFVVMKGNCNDDFYHAVHVGDSDRDRVSLVLKRALDRNGKKRSRPAGTRKKVAVEASARQWRPRLSKNWKQESKGKEDENKTKSKDKQVALHFNYRNVEGIDTVTVDLYYKIF